MRLAPFFACKYHVYVCVLVSLCVCVVVLLLCLCQMIVSVHDCICVYRVLMIVSLPFSTKKVSMLINTIYLCVYVSLCVYVTVWVKSFLLLLMIVSVPDS